MLGLPPARTGTSSLAGLDDRLHQPYRAKLYPRSAELLEKVRKLGALGPHHLRSRPDRADLVALRADRRAGPRPPRSPAGPRMGTGRPGAVRGPGRRRARPVAAQASAAAGRRCRWRLLLSLGSSLRQPEPAEQLIGDVEVIGREVGAEVEDRDGALGRFGVRDRRADRGVDQLLAGALAGARRTPRASGGCACRRC